MKKRLLLTSALVLSAMSAAHAALIMYEGFDYTVGSNNPDADAASGQANGLPATNVGGSPSGTGTGLRGNWGTTLDVAAGLTYSQGGNSLIVSGGSGAPNNATWGSSGVSAYRFMATDPFLSQRIAADGGFGVDGTSLFVSMLAQTSSATAAAFNITIAGSTGRNVFIQNTATGWSLNDNSAGAAATTATLSLNTPTLLVLRYDFAAGANDVVSLWANPTLGAPLGVANASLTVGVDFGGITSIQTRPSTLSAMTVDEIRMGTTYADVTPFAIPEPSAFAALAGLGALGLAATRRRRRA